MISQEEIYDLDTETLQQRVTLLEQQLRKWSPRSKKKAERTLELAKLEIEQRQADTLLEQFENKLSKISFLYLDEQPKPIKNPQPQPFAKQKKSLITQSCKKVFTIPKTDEMFQYKPVKQKRIPEVRKSHNNVSSKLSTVNEFVTNRKKIYSKTSTTVQVNSVKKKEEVDAKKQIELLEQLNTKIQRQDTEAKKLINKVKFIENQQSISSDEEINAKQNQIFQVQLIKTENGFQCFKQEEQVCLKEVSKQIQSTHYSIVDDKLAQTQCNKQADSVNFEQIQLQQQAEPIITNTIDYFRFTVVKKREEKQTTQSQLSQTQEKTIIPPVCEINNIPLSLQIKELLPQRQDNEIKEPICYSQRKIPDPSPKIQQRPQSQYITKKKQRALTKYQPAKLIKQLPAPTVSYNEIIPTFNHLFPPNSDVFLNMRVLVGIIEQHLKIKTESNMRANLKCNNREYFSDKYQHLIDIQLKRQNIWAQEREKQNPATSFYYRVIKTKQQVYDIITDTFDRTHWYELPHGMNLKQSWNLLWTWAKPQIDFKSLIYFQKVNHFVNNKQISRKDLLKKNIQKIKRLGVKICQIFDIIPDTYLLPGETDNFIQKFQQFDKEKEKNNIWIMKPIGLSRGRGIRLVKSLNDIYYDEPVVLQKYLKDPLLLDGYKFDMRIYVVVTSINPLEAFIYRQGFARMSTEQYSLDDLDNNFVHLTNFSIQRQNVKEGNSVGGSKISLKMLQQRLERKGIAWDGILTQIIQIVLKSLISCMNQIPSLPNCFELFGYDIIIDSTLKCWLLQVNSSPSLEKQYVLDQLIKQQLIDDIIAIIDPISFNRVRLKEVLERRIMEVEGRKSYINTTNNSVQQLNRDLCYILDGKQIPKYGEKKSTKNFVQIAPSEEYFKLVKVLQSYKRTNIIKKI